MASPVKKRDLPNSVTCTERGKPVLAFFKNSAIHNTLANHKLAKTLSLTCFGTRCPARVTLPMQVEEDGKSECLPVMGRIGDEMIALT